MTANLPESVSGTCAIEALFLSHFRSHKVTRIEPKARLVALYGPNGAGKTNILEAISYLSPGRGLRRAVPEDIRRREDAAPGWKVAARLRVGATQHELETWAEAGSGRHVHLDGKAVPQNRLGNLLRILWLVPAMDRLWTEAAEGRRRFLDRMTLSFDPAHADDALRYEKAMRERNRLLKDQVTDAHWYRAVEAQMAATGAAILLRREAAIAAVTAAQRDGLDIFPKAALALIGPDADEDFPRTEEALLDALSEGRNRDMSAGRTLVGPHRCDLSAIYAAKSIPARETSTGEQKALLISLVLANVRALAMATGAAPVVLLDEVAAHLDQERQAALYDELDALGAQAWLTGTGRELFDALGARADYLQVTDDAGLSIVSEAGLNNQH